MTKQISVFQSLGEGAVDIIVHPEFSSPSPASLCTSLFGYVVANRQCSSGNLVALRSFLETYDTRLREGLGKLTISSLP